MSSSLFGKDYDSVQIGGGNTLPAGGYVCRIIQAKLSETKDKKLPMVEALIDIIDGDYTQYFSKKYERNKKEHGKTAKYPNNGILRVVAVDADGNTKKNFKSFCTAIEESNQIELPRDNDAAFLKAIKDKEIGVLFGREQFESTDGNLLWSTKPRWYRSTESILNKEYEIPEDQYLEPSVPYATGIEGVDSFSAAEDDIPF